MVYALVLGTSVERHGGSTPLPGTKQTTLSDDSVFCYRGKGSIYSSISSIFGKYK